MEILLIILTALSIIIIVDKTIFKEQKPKDMINGSVNFTKSQHKAIKSIHQGIHDWDCDLIYKNINGVNVPIIIDTKSIVVDENKSSIVVNDMNTYLLLMAALGELETETEEENVEG